MFFNRPPPLTSAPVKQSGHAILYVNPKDGSPQETYLITLRTCNHKKQHC